MVSTVFLVLVIFVSGPLSGPAIKGTWVQHILQISGLLFPRSLPATSGQFCLLSDSASKQQNRSRGTGIPHRKVRARKLRTHANMSDLIVVGDRVLIEPLAGEQMTESGLVLPATVTDKDKVQGGRIVPALAT